MSKAAVGVGMEVRLLGPVEVMREGRVVPLRGTRQRALLALLALHANEVVTSGRLVEALFGVDAGASAVNAVQAGISRLRRLLGEGVLETRAPGYVLHVIPDGLDVARFEHLYAEGLQLLEEGDAPAAAAALREALALFRGDPLADVSMFDFAQTEIRRLEEMRLAALIERIDADLALGRGGELVAELETLVRENPLQERLRGQMMLALYRSGRQADALDVCRDTRRLLRDELGLEPSRALQELEVAMLRQDPALELEPRADAPVRADEPALVVCPFKGLAPFTSADAEFFFGRERLVDDLIVQLASHPFLGIIGASGSGKSSLIQAGLLPALQRGGLPGSEAWKYLLARPGDQGRIEAALASDQRVVVAVDQFEELFTSHEDEQAALLDALARATLDVERRCIVVVALRADFYGRCAAFPEFARILSRHHILLGPMRREQLVHAIEGPAVKAGLRVERDLVEAMLNDLEGEPGGLPLLSTTLLELWQGREGRVLTHSSYRLSGGVRSAVARIAERAYLQFEGGERQLARAALLRLVTEEDNIVARRRVPLDELDLAGSGDAAQIVAVLTDARLLTVSEGTVEISHEALLSEWPRLRDWLEDDREGRRLRAELARSARDWAEGGRHPGDVYRGPRLVVALEWAETHDTELSGLEREFVEASRIEQERELLEQRRQNRTLRGLLGGLGVLLVLALIAGGAALVARSNAKHEATVALARQLGAEAVSEPRIDLAMLLARESVALDPSLRTRSDLLTTLMRAPTAIQTFHWNTNRNLGLLVSPDGRTIAIEDNDGNTVVEDAATARRIGVLHADILGFGPDGSLLTAAGGTLTGSHDGIDVLDPRTLKVARMITFPQSARGADSVTVSVTFAEHQPRMAVLVARQQDAPRGPVTLANSVVQFNYETGQVTAPTISLPTDVALVAYSPGGRRLIVVRPNATIVFAAHSGRRIRSYPVGGVPAALSPDAKTLAIGSGDGSVRFLDLAIGRVTLGVGAASGGASTMGFTPDDATLVTTTQDGRTLLWDVASHTIRDTLTGHAGPIHTQAISSDGSTLYTGSFDSNVEAWDLTGRRSFALSFPAATTDSSLQAWSLAVSPDSRTIAVGSTTGMVDLWDATTLRKVRSFRAVPGVVAALAFGPDGRSLLVAGNTPQPGRAWLRIWKLAPHPQLLRSLGGLQRITWATWSPNGKTVAATGYQLNQNPEQAGIVAEWNAVTGRTLGPLVVVHGGHPVDVSFAPQGTTIAVSGYRFGAEVLDPAKGALERQFSVRGGTYTMGVAFSPDGSRLATTDWSGSLDLRDPNTGKMIGAPIPDPGQQVTNSVAWSPDGRTIAVTDWSNTLRLFDVASRQELGPPVPLGNPNGDTTYPYATFTPDGAKVVVSDDTGQVWILPVSLKAWEDRACQIAGRNLTRAEWQQFVTGHGYANTCPQFRAG